MSIHFKEGSYCESIDWASTNGGEYYIPMKPALRLLSGELAILRLPPGAATPSWLSCSPGPLVSVTRTAEELSIVCPSGAVPSKVECEAGWRAFKVEGKLEFSAIGVLAAIVNPLAQAGISILSISTFDTDYILLRANMVEMAKDVLGQTFRLID